MRRFAWLLAAITASSAAAPAALRSGLQVGEHPLPFTSNVVTGKDRGTQHCYVCDLTDEPAILVFLRQPNEPAARVLKTLSESSRQHRGQKLFGWVVFLGQANTGSETTLERQAYDLARENGATALAVTVLGDPQGPPGYLIAPEAEATVLAFRRGKILYNRSYRTREWSPRGAETAVKEAVKGLSLEAAAN